MKWWKARDPQLRAVVVTVVGGLGVVVVASWLLAWVALGVWPWELHPKPGEPPNALDIIKIALAFAAGVGGAVALVTGYRRQALAEREESATDVLRFDQRFGSAAAQLGGATPAIRMAGVYAMAALADQYPARRQQCVDVLCGYLRLPWDPADDHIAVSTTETTHSAVERTVREVTTPARQHHDREVRATILAIIRAHLIDPDALTNWCNLDFNLGNARLENVDLSRVTFSGARTSFNGAMFSG
ncbi:MAG: hypothetical protein ACRCYU_03325, partial [Nocardioides sp.]